MSVVARERGQAHLPDLELIRGESLNPDGKAFKGDHTSEYRNLSGWEGGLAPALWPKKSG